MLRRMVFTDLIGLFRNEPQRFAAKYKPARFHIILAVRLLINAQEPPRMNSTAMESYANDIIAALSAPGSDQTFLNAVELVDEISGSNMDRDHIRQKPITDALLIRFGLHPRTE